VSPTEFIDVKARELTVPKYAAYRWTRWS